MNNLGLFAKFWQPGTVKTRLGASIGLTESCEIYKLFLFHLLTRHQATGHFRDVVFSPPEARSKFRDSIPTHWEFCPQNDGDLGERMAGYFREKFERIQIESENQTNNSINQAASGGEDSKSNCNKIVIIGADCPLLGGELINSAFDQLDEVAVVIGPSLDGGYYLLGMREKCWNVFSDIQWSTSDVLPDTIKHLERQQISYHLLEPMNDIDEIDDLLKLAAQMKDPTKQLDSLEQNLLREIEEVLARSSYDKDTDPSDTGPSDTGDPNTNPRPESS